MNVRHVQASPGRLQAHGVRWAWHAIGAHIWWLLMAGRALVTGATGFVGCGTFGGNSTTDNVGYMNLTNIKRLAEPIP